MIINEKNKCDDFFILLFKRQYMNFKKKHNLQLFNSITCNEYAHRNINGRMENEHRVLEYIEDKEKYKRNFTWYFKT
ncbi:MAG: hypothetical protein CMP61_04010 [Flavobacteriales bacterium]|nr:hypothetical protein [Flavobacteriales bacterium]